MLLSNFVNWLTCWGEMLLFWCRWLLPFLKALAISLQKARGWKCLSRSGHVCNMMLQLCRQTSLNVHVLWWLRLPQHQAYQTTRNWHHVWRKWPRSGNRWSTLPTAPSLSLILNSSPMLSDRVCLFFCRLFIYCCFTCLVFGLCKVHLSCGKTPMI